MRRSLTGLLAVLLAFALVYLLVANRQLAYLSLDVTNADDPALAFGPTWTAVHMVVGLVIGFILGAIGMWSSGAAKRAELRRSRREVRRLEEELREARQGIYEAQPTGSALVPVNRAQGDRTDVLAVSG